MPRLEPGEAMYTFGLQWEDWMDPEFGPDQVHEEIDVVARSPKEAEEKARAEANEGYRPGWRLIKMPPGGSGGFMHIISFGGPT